MPTIDPQLMTRDVTDLLATVRQTRDWSILPIVADALLDAGAADEFAATFRDGSCEWKLEAAVEDYVAVCDAIAAEHWQEMGFTFSAPPKHRADYISDKWVRVVRLEQRNGVFEVSSVHSFVARADNRTKSLGTVARGDIHKPASFKAPAKHARGSVFGDAVRKSLSTYGPNYLR